MPEAQQTARERMLDRIVSWNLDALEADLLFRHAADLRCGMGPAEARYLDGERREQASAMIRQAAERLLPHELLDHYRHTRREHANELERRRVLLTAKGTP